MVVFTSDKFHIKDVLPDDYPPAFDVVVSASLLSQISVAVEEAAPSGDDSKKVAFGVQMALRDAHFRHVIDLVAPGGVGLFLKQFYLKRY